MPQIIQNLACVELLCSTSERRISFAKDILRGKRVRSLFIFASSNELDAVNPYRDEVVTSIEALRETSLFLNLIDIKGETFFQNLSFEQFLTTTQYASIFDLSIGRVLDLDQCFISIKADVIAAPIKLLMYVLYETEVPAPLKDEMNGTLTVTIPITEIYEDIKLSDFLGFKLRDKAIRQIYQNGTNVFYLDLICTNGRRIENMPFDLLQLITPNKFYFDNIKIDYEQSYIRVRQSIALDGESNMTFIY